MVPYVIFAFLKAASLLKKNKYILIHNHFIFPDTIVTSLLKRLFKKPLIVTTHGSDVPGYNPHRFKILHMLLMPLWRKIVISADAIACPSQYISDLICTREPRAKTIIIPNGINIDKFDPNIKKHDSILVVTRMFARKGVQYFLRALKEIGFKGAVNIVGDGPHLSYLKDITKKLKINSVIFHGFVDNKSEQLKRLYESSRIFVFTSEAENFPVVLLEAMTAGLAIITTRGTGCAEVVGDTAILVEPKNSSQIRDKIVNLLNNPHLREDYGQRARARLVDKFSWEAVGDQYDDLYKSVSV
jgi:glycosyltransferase involved in cell wall biosynthesis